ncbi:nucleotidyltransferase domain-containing protein [Catellatospora sichuanensis]|uniref:nucleotidyltransferase domain-containing protein n=1 Tax=Catellatospora sichuanensis TaxID=1969805 RepID=UPI001FED2183|nr:nucleotidyltransferase domain-containing protein [Catellatospora sichuanensis]
METDLAERLLAVSGVVAVVLGGSRARGEHRPDSDTDLGLYYRGPLDVDALRALAVQVATAHDVYRPGDWGPWVDGGAWLTVDGRAVDWIYRDLDRVRSVWADCRQGRYTVERQVGHPLGFYSHAYAGELALCRVLADPTGEVAALREQALDYPVALGDALVAALWEAEFCITGARKVPQDRVYVAGCLFRAVGVMAQALHGRAGRWTINEKGIVASAARLPVAPPDFAALAEAAVTDVDAAAALLAQVRSATA